MTSGNDEMEDIFENKFVNKNKIILNPEEEE